MIRATARITGPLLGTKECFVDSICGSLGLGTGVGGLLVAMALGSRAATITHFFSPLSKEEMHEKIKKDSAA